MVLAASRCFLNVQQAVNAYCAYGNPDTFSQPGHLFQRDSCTLSGPSSVFVNAHRTDLSTGVTVPFTFTNPVNTCGDTIDPAKNNGPQCCAGNPINTATGNKYQEELDYKDPAGVLTVVRAYNSAGIVMPVFDFGAFWQSGHSKRIVYTPNGSIGLVAAYRAGGRFFRFELINGTWLPEPDVADRLTELKNALGLRTGWQYYEAATEQTETYDIRGIPIAITSRAGLSQTLAYSDGALGGPNGGQVLDANGNPTAAVLPAGLLVRVSDAYGRSLSYGYDAAKRIVKISDPAGGSYLYSYDAGGRLITVTYPDGKFRAYLYENAGIARALTGIVDENGGRYSTYVYDVQGRAISTEHAGGVQKYQVSIGSATSSVVTDPLGTQRPRTFETTQGVRQITSDTQPGSSGPSSTASTHDANGNLTSYTDFNGNRTSYAYDLSRNLQTLRTEGLTSAGAATPQTRTVTTEWHPGFRLVKRTAEPLRITTYVYNGDGGASCGFKSDGVTPVPSVLCSKTLQATTDANGSQGFSAAPAGAARAWSYTYNANGSVLTADGPRADVFDLTTYTYYANNDPDLGKRGNVATITNASGHTTSIAEYNAHGQPLTIVDPNGLTTTLTYDPRLRLTSRTVGGESTTYAYDNAGQLTKVTLPDGSFLSYSYDGAHRLTGMQDNLGNRVVYTLDLAGNRMKEDVLDPSNQLAQTRSRIYSSLNRLFRELGAQNQATEYAYDNQGNVTSVKDPLNRTTVNQYDALNRLRQVTDPATGVTQYAYNGLDALTQVRDPRNLVTGYAVDGLGNLSQQVSPDTGTTTNTYDLAGNLLTQTDAKSQTTTYVYDALNRVTQIAFHDGSKQVYAYDQGANSLGRLSSITERNAANDVTNVIAYAYDKHGRVTSETRTVNGVQYILAYSYDGAGRLSGLTYPSGRAVTYSFDALGRVNQVSTAKGSESQIVVQNVAYHPFGGVKGFTHGNGQSYTRSYDQDGRVASYSLGASQFAIGYDAASRIAFISDVGNPANSNNYGYDALDRLTSALLPSTPFAYSYDAVGNRVSKTVGSVTENYTYSTTSNQLSTVGPRTFAFDPNGSTVDDGQNSYVYDARGRMVQATSVVGATNYQINALGQRIRKTNSSADTVFHYDTRGKLIAESDPGGGFYKRELIYLGDMPVGVFQ